MQVLHVEDRVLGLALDLAKGNGAHGGRGKRGPQQGRACRGSEVREVDLLNAKQKQHDGSNKQDGAGRVEAMVFLVLARTILARGAQEHEGCNDQRHANGNSDVEEHVPALHAHKADDGTTRGGSENVREARNRSSQAQRHAALLGREGRADGSVGNGNHAAGAGRLNHASYQQQRKAAHGLGDAAQNRTDCKHAQAQGEHLAAAATVSQLANYGDQSRIEERVNVDHPNADLVVEAERCLHHRAHRRNHAHVQAAHKKAEQINGEDGAKIGRLLDGTAAKSALRFFHDDSPLPFLQCKPRGAQKRPAATIAASSH